MLVMSSGVKTSINIAHIIDTIQPLIGRPQFTSKIASATLYEKIII